MFGNFALTLPASERILIAWAMNWNIRCRGDAELRQIFAHTPFGAESLRVEPEPLGASLLVMATRR